MLIDPSGEGVFDSDNMIIVKCSNPDLTREKPYFTIYFGTLTEAAATCLHSPTMTA